MPKDGRTVGVIVHHVASVYPIEIQLAQTLAEGKPVERRDRGRHRRDERAHAVGERRRHEGGGVDLLRQNSAAAAAAIRALSDEQLAKAAPVSLYADAPLTCQFVLEDHAVRHSYHHLARMRRALRP